MTNASLRDAILTRAVLVGANLDGVDLRTRCSIDRAGVGVRTGFWVG
ncbi:pentapeptide repeat-containing protein [Streptomyces sp. NPDC127069]